MKVAVQRNSSQSYFSANQEDDNAWREVSARVRVLLTGDITDFVNEAGQVFTDECPDFCTL